MRKGASGALIIEVYLTVHVEDEPNSGVLDRTYPPDHLVHVLRISRIKLLYCYYCTAT